jgi:AcrR family transcriptional regulator
MAIPAQTGKPWSELCNEEKRARTLAVADALFARDGVDVPMPALAEAIGIGVGSIYRQFASKDDVLAALMIARIDSARERFLAALEEDPWEGLCRAVLETVETATADHVSMAAWEELSRRPDVQPAREAVSAVLEQVVARARAAGALREDVTAEDVRLIFGAARLEPRGARRLAELMLRGMGRNRSLPAS